MDGLPERVVRDTTAGIPGAIVTFIDWIIDGTLPEEKIDSIFKSIEILLVEAGGSSLGGAAAMTLSSALYVSGLKGKILAMGNGDSVLDLARVAVQQNGNIIDKAIESVIVKRDDGGNQLNQLLREVLAAAVKLLPGASETSLIMELIGQGLASMGYTANQLSALVTIFTRYPDRVYGYLRRVFTIASLHGHDVSRRGTQAEIFAHSLPRLITYFTEIAKAEKSAASESRQLSPIPSSNSAAAEPSTESQDEATADEESGFFTSLYKRASKAEFGSGKALQVASYAAAAFGASSVVALTTTAAFAQTVYKGHKETTEEIDAWNIEASKMLRQASQELTIEQDWLADSAINLLLASITAIILPVGVGLWPDVERIIRSAICDPSTGLTIFDGYPELALVLGMEPLTAATSIIAIVLYAISVWMLYKNVAFFRYLSPSIMLSILFMGQYLNTWFNAYSGCNNLMKLLLNEKSSAVSGPPLIFAISSLSNILKQSTLVNFGRLLPFIFIVGYFLGYADSTFHIVTIAIGKLGQMLLSSMVRERRGVQRKIVLWCFDDLLQAMSPVADSTYTPDQKLHVVTPGVFATSLVRCLNEQKALILGAIMGAGKQIVGKWWPLLLLTELILIIAYAAVTRRGLEQCWNRWTVLLPEHSERIGHLEMIWRAYLQARPEFVLESIQSSDGYGIAIVLLRPWVSNATKYKIYYRKSVTFMATPNEWIAHGDTAVDSEAAFLKHTRSGNDRIELKNLDMGVFYEVRIDACGDKPHPSGFVRRCCTGTPIFVATSASTTGINLKTSAPPSPDLNYYIRYRRGHWPWIYRSGYNPLTATSLTLDDVGECRILNLTPGSTYELQLQVRGEGTVTDWLGTTPPTISLPAPEVPVEPQSSFVPAETETIAKAAETPREAGKDDRSPQEPSDIEQSEPSQQNPHVEDKTPHKTRQAQALFTYVAEHDYELSVQQGDNITVLYNVDENWVRAENNGKEGIIPRSYLS